MELSEHVAALRRELAALTRFAGEDVARSAELLADALESSVRLMLLDALSAAAAEITTRLDDVVIDVRLSSGEPEFVVTATPQDPPPGGQARGVPEAGEEAGTARVTLRLSEALKARIEAGAAAAAVSVNTWLVSAAARALEEPGASGRGRSPGGVGQRLTGYYRS